MSYRALEALYFQKLKRTVSLSRVSTRILHRQHWRRKAPGNQDPWDYFLTLTYDQHLENNNLQGIRFSSRRKHGTSLTTGSPVIRGKYSACPKGQRHSNIDSQVYMDQWRGLRECLWIWESHSSDLGRTRAISFFAVSLPCSVPPQTALVDFLVLREQSSPLGLALFLSPHAAGNLISLTRIWSGLAVTLRGDLVQKTLASTQIQPKDRGTW